MQIDWKQKFSSRKFWALIGGFVTSVLLAFNLDQNQIGQVTAIITAFGSVAVYILAEASIDKAASQAPVVLETVVVEKEEV